MLNRAGVLRTPAAILLSLVLVGQAAAYYFLPKTETAPTPPAMNGFTATIGDWRLAQTYPIEEEVQKVLRADDTMNRVYTSPSAPFGINLFMAYFHSQKTGVAPHSPKNCLPGSGWAPIDSSTTEIRIPGRPDPIEVNRFIVARGSERTLVLYWYQTAHRVIASEYSAKIWLVLDSLRYRRSDTAIVRVVAPLPENDNGKAERIATDFIASAFPAIAAQLPAQ